MKFGEKCETPKCSFFVIHACNEDNVHELKPTRTERKRETLFSSEKRSLPPHPPSYTEIFYIPKETEQAKKRKKEKELYTIVFGVL